MPHLPTITERYPPMELGALTRGIGSFDGMVLDEKRQFVDRVVAAHPVLSMEWGPGWRFRRARVLDTSSLVTHVDDTIWNTKAPARLGRANPAGFPVMYVADRMETALAEAHVNDDHVAISEFSILPGRSARMAPIGELELIQRSGRGALSGDTSKDISDMLNACAPDQARSLLIADAFLLSVLTNIQNDYELSSTVAMAIFNKSPDVKVIAYPSMRARGSICFAIKTAGFWDDWGLVAVRQGLVRHLAMSYYAIDEVRNVTGIHNDGELQWASSVGAGNVTQLLNTPWTPG